MSKTLVATFRSVSEAQNVKRELLKQGFADGDIRIVSNEQGTSGTTGGYASQSATQDTGVLGSIKHFFSSFTEADENDHDYYGRGITSGGAMLSATVPDDRVQSTRALLEQYGASDFEQGVASQSPRTSAATAGAANVEGNVAIPVVEEQLQVGKREVARGGVRVYSHVTERPVEENVQLREEHVHVQRNAVNRPASEADFQAFKEGTVELTETAEEAVVSKQARVVEEVVVGKDVTERTETVRDNVRRKDVEVEEIAPELRNTKTSGR